MNRMIESLQHAVAMSCPILQLSAVQVERSEIEVSAAPALRDVYCQPERMRS